MKKLKGSALVTVIIVVAVAAVVGVVAYYFWGFGGKGDEEVSGNAETAPVMATVPETTTETTTVTTEEIEYIEVTVDGNNYIFISKSYEISQTDDLIEKVKNKNNDGKLTIKIIDENASLKAYETLIAAFKENHIKYIEVS